MESILKLKGKLKNPIVTVGTFDGVHLGHQRIMQKMVERAQKINGDSLVVTYHPHPLEILRQEHFPYLLSEPQKKEEFLKKLGIDYVVELDFDRKMAGMDPENFVQDCFVDKLHAVEIILGYDWHFGKNRRGDYHLLKKLQTKYGFKVDMINEVLLDQQIVSSTKIRDYLGEGNVEFVNKMLGRDYQILGTTGKSIKSKKCNSYKSVFAKHTSRKLLPKSGVYLAEIELNNEKIKILLDIPLKPDTDQVNLYSSQKIFKRTAPIEIALKKNIHSSIENLDKNSLQKLLHTNNN